MWFVRTAHTEEFLVVIYQLSSKTGRLSLIVSGESLALHQPCGDGDALWL
jgi:hypothetical protein